MSETSLSNTGFFWWNVFVLAPRHLLLCQQRLALVPVASRGLDVAHSTLKLSGSSDLPTSASPSAGITGIASPSAGVTGMCHHA